MFTNIFRVASKKRKNPLMYYFMMQNKKKQCNSNLIAPQTTDVPDLTLPPILKFVRTTDDSEFVLFSIKGLSVRLTSQAFEWEQMKSVKNREYLPIKKSAYCTTDVLHARYLLTDS